jgi:hypothetical protein
MTPSLIALAHTNSAEAASSSVSFEAMSAKEMRE